MPIRTRSAQRQGWIEVEEKSRYHSSFAYRIIVLCWIILVMDRFAGTDGLADSQKIEGKAQSAIVSCFNPENLLR